MKKPFRMADGDEQSVMLVGKSGCCFGDSFG